MFTGPRRSLGKNLPGVCNRKGLSLLSCPEQVPGHE